MIKVCLIFLFLFCSCSTQTSYPVSEKEKLANSVLVNTAKAITKKYGLSPFGNGGQMMDEIKMLYLAFECRRPLTIDETRPMIIDCVNILVTAINENEKIRPYLAKYPFTPDNIEMVIFFQDNMGNDVSDLIIVSVDKGNIKYKVSDSTVIGRTILEEPFEKATKICKHIIPKQTQKSDACFAIP